jgi:hypothetical protein
MTKTISTFAIAIIVSFASVACGSAATPAATSPLDASEAVNAAPHELDVAFQMDDASFPKVSEAEQTAAHEPPPTVGMRDVVPTNVHSVTALR